MKLIQDNRISLTPEETALARAGMKVLQVNPLDPFGSPLEIVDLFGGKMQYLKALTELEIVRTTSPTG